MNVAPSASAARLLLQASLWFIAAFHVGVGVILNVSPAGTRAVAARYGATRVDWTLQFHHILRPLGAFMIALGVIAAATAPDPLRHPQVVLGFALLFALRAAQRVAFGREMADAFGIPPHRVRTNIAVFTAQAVVLAALWWLARGTADATA